MLSDGMNKFDDFAEKNCKDIKMKWWVTLKLIT